MIDVLIAWSLRQSLFIVILAGLLAVAGVVAFQTLPIDAFPDVTNIQVQILTDGPGLSPVEVERFITFPIELQMTGLPDLTAIRSLSKFALSQVTVVFKDHVDILRTRQFALERLIEVRGADSGTGTSMVGASPTGAVRRDKTSKLADRGQNFFR